MAGYKGRAGRPPQHKQNIKVCQQRDITEEAGDRPACASTAGRPQHRRSVTSHSLLLENGRTLGEKATGAGLDDNYCRGRTGIDISGLA